VLIQILVSQNPSQLPQHRRIHEQATIVKSELKASIGLVRTVACPLIVQVISQPDNQPVCLGHTLLKCRQRSVTCVAGTNQSRSAPEVFESHIMRHPPVEVNPRTKITGHVMSANRPDTQHKVRTDGQQIDGIGQDVHLGPCTWGESQGQLGRNDSCQALCMRDLQVSAR